MLETQDLKALLKETMREVLREERLNLCLALTPYVGDEEMAEIAAQLGKPEDYTAEDFVVMTDWVKHGNPI